MRSKSGARAGSATVMRVAVAVAVPVAVAVSLAWSPLPAAGQSVVERSPNLSGGWVVAPGVVQFNFLHRFNQSGPPERKVVSSPSFHLAAGLPGATLVGVTYATHSEVVPRLPNEWAFFGRWAPIAQEEEDDDGGGAPLDLAAEVGYNLAARSVDGEVSVARRLGPVRLIGAARALSNAYDAGDARMALAAGASLRLLDGLALAGDVASLLDRTDDERVGWGAAAQIQIPYTPHSLSLHVTNVNTATLHGTSAGAENVRYGFEFTIPITLRRYLPRSEPDEESPPVAADDPDAGDAADTPVAAFAASDTVVVTIENLAYDVERVEISPGTTVVWRNEDAVMHTATADDGRWDSDEIEPGESWSRTFDEPGSHPYTCTPHPFMTGVVVVGGSEEGGSR